MRFLSVRELRASSAEVWRRLAQEREIVITSKGKPLALLSTVDEASLESSIAALKAARAMAAVTAMQTRSYERRSQRPSAKEIAAEIARVRRARAA